MLRCPVFNLRTKSYVQLLTTSNRNILKIFPQVFVSEKDLFKAFAF